MVNDMNSQDDQALADEWAAALEETGDAGQSDIDAFIDQARPMLRRLCSGCPWRKRHT